MTGLNGQNQKYGNCKLQCEVHVELDDYRKNIIKPNPNKCILKYPYKCTISEKEKNNLTGIYKGNPA